jgi:predicted Zn-dependent protease
MATHQHLIAARHTRQRLPAVLICLLLAGCAAPEPFVKRPPASADPVARTRCLLLEESSRQQLAITASGRRVEHPDLDAYLARILRSLLPATASGDGIEARVHVLRDAEPDAYSFPDGAIFIHTGLLVQLESEAELALVLAHELAHIVHHDALRAVLVHPSRSEPPPPSDVIARIGDFAAWFGGHRPWVDQEPFLRQLETEADLASLDMLSGANYNLVNALKIFDHLKSSRIAGHCGGPAGAECAAAATERAENLTRVLTENYPRKTGRSGRGQDFFTNLMPAFREQSLLDLRCGRFDDALRCALVAARAAPGEARGHFLLGEIFRRRDRAGDPQLALGSYQRAVTLDPSLAEAHKALGFMHFKQGQCNQARKAFETGLALAPDALDTGYIRHYLSECCCTEGETP